MKQAFYGIVFDRGDIEIIRIEGAETYEQARIVVEEAIATNWSQDVILSEEEFQKLKMKIDEELEIFQYE